MSRNYSILGNPRSDVLPKGHETDNNRGDKGKIYDVISLNWSINNYDVYNINELIEVIIFYTYIIFI
jgi:hypothetical protein